MALFTVTGRRYHREMFFIGLTGGIASGKSTITRRLAELGAVTLDADQLARVVVEPGTPGLQLVREAFGDGVIAADGSLDRAALGALVFRDPEQLAVLNGIVHPAIQQHVAGVISELEAENPDGVLVYDIPLLVESDHDYVWDLVVVADAPDEARIERMVELRGMTEDEARARIANQATNEARRAVADVVIDTSGTVEETIAQTDAFWHKLVADRGLRAGNSEREGGSGV